MSFSIPPPPKGFDPAYDERVREEEEGNERRGTFVGKSIDETEQARRAAELEAAADAVMETRHLLVELDRRANQNREGYRALVKLQKEQEEARKRTLEQQKQIALRQLRESEQGGARVTLRNVLGNKDAGSKSVSTRVPEGLRGVMGFSKQRAERLEKVSNTHREKTMKEIEVIDSREKKDDGDQGKNKNNNKESERGAPSQTNDSLNRILGGGVGCIAMASSASTDNLGTETQAACSARLRQKHVWMLSSSAGTFLKYNTISQAIDKLEVDKVETEKDIEFQREMVKAQVVELAQLEGPDSALARLNEGFDLKAVNK